jgi:hypothetical protein
MSLQRKGRIMDSALLDQLEAAYGEELDPVRGDLGQLESGVEAIAKLLGDGQTRISCWRT